MMIDFKNTKSTTETVECYYNIWCFVQVITLNNVPESIYMEPSAIREDMLSGHMIAHLHTQDQDEGQSFTYELLSQKPQREIFKIFSIYLNILENLSKCN